MREEQFCLLPSQATIYSVTRLGNHLIIGTGDFGKVFAHIGTSIMQQLPLQNLPYDCEIISIDGSVAGIDAFPVLAVAFLQKCAASANGAMLNGRGNGYVTSHLNIYSTWISVDQDSPTSTSSSASSDSSRFNTKSVFHPKEEFHSSQFELLAQNCTVFQLNYIPYHLHHIPVVKENGNFGNILLLSGSDRKIHSYEADEDNSTFVEVEIKTYFPELAQTFPNVVTSLLIQPVNELTRRITMCGMENGMVLIITASSKYHKRRRMDSENTVTSGNATPSKSLRNITEGIHILGLDNTNDESADELGLLGCEDDGCLSEEMLDSVDESFKIISHHYDGLITSIRSYTECGVRLNVIVSSALSPTYVYSNVIEDNFSSGKALKFSSDWDVVNCCCVEDIDRDGENEIVIGTYRALLVYKYMGEILPAWVIVSHKKMPRPCLAIDFVHPNLLVVSGLGLHIISYDTSAYFKNKPSVTLSDSDQDD